VLFLLIAVGWAAVMDDSGFVLRAMRRGFEREPALLQSSRL